MDLEFYTVKQAARRLGCAPDEVEHFIERFKLPVSVFLRDEQLIITTGRTGRAVVRYEGLFELSERQVSAFFREEAVFIDDPISIEVKGISDYQEDPPVDAKLYIREADVALDSWESWSYSQVSTMKTVTAIFCSPLRHEHFQEAHRRKREMELAENGQTDLPEFIFDWIRELYVSDLVILHDDLAAFRQQYANGSEKKNPGATNASTTPIAMTINRQRQNELHLLIVKVLAAHPIMSATGVWQALANDAEKINRVFDEDEILIKVSKDSIAWVSSHGNQQKIKRSSWASTVSRLKKEALVCG